MKLVIRNVAAFLACLPAVTASQSAVEVTVTPGASSSEYDHLGPLHNELATNPSDLKKKDLEAKLSAMNVTTSHNASRVEQVSKDAHKPLPVLGSLPVVEAPEGLNWGLAKKPVSKDTSKPAPVVEEAKEFAWGSTNGGFYFPVEEASKEFDMDQWLDEAPDELPQKTEEFVWGSTNGGFHFPVEEASKEFDFDQWMDEAPDELPQKTEEFVWGSTNGGFYFPVEEAAKEFDIQQWLDEAPNELPQKRDSSVTSKPVVEEAKVFEWGSTNGGFYFPVEEASKEFDLDQWLEEAPDELPQKTEKFVWGSTNGGFYFPVEEASKEFDLDQWLDEAPDELPTRRTQRKNTPMRTGGPGAGGPRTKPIN